MTANSHFQKLAITYLASAKANLSNEEFDHINLTSLKRLIPLLAESIPLEHLVEPAMIQHAVNGLKEQWQSEEILMHLFLLSVYQLYAQGTQHPLEKGIIRQKIISLLPLFEHATHNGKIRPAFYDRNADALAHFADDTDEINTILPALSKELHRFETINDTVA